MIFSFTQTIKELVKKLKELMLKFSIRMQNSLSNQ